MRGFLLRMAITALGLWVASEIVPGMRIEGVASLFLAAVLLGMANALVRPLVVLLTLPLTLLTLGLFLLVINALMLALVAALMPRLTLDGFWAALLGSLVVSVTSWFASSFVGGTGRLEALGARRGSPPPPSPPRASAGGRWLRSALWTLAVLGALAALVIWTSLSQVRWECDVWMEYRGRGEHRIGASATREDALRSAVTSACATLASGMADSMACDRTPPERVECRER